MAKYKVIFYGRTKREIASVDTVRECNLAIKKFLIEHNYKSYYWRTYANNSGGIEIDVGSHTEFFVIERTDGTPLTTNLLFKAEAEGV